METVITFFFHLSLVLKGWSCVEGHPPSSIVIPENFIVAKNPYGLAFKFGVGHHSRMYNKFNVGTVCAL